MNKKYYHFMFFLFLGLFLGVVFSRIHYSNEQSIQNNSQSNIAQKHQNKPNDKCITNINATSYSPDTNHISLEKKPNNETIDNKFDYKSFLKSPNDYRITLTAAIHAMDDEQAMDVITNILHLEPEYIDSITEPKAYLKKTADILLNNEQMNENTHNDGSSVHFSPDKPESIHNAPYEAPYVFTPETKKIHANFPSETYSEDSVLVKWIHADTGEIILFKSYDINPYEDFNYVWVNKEKWDVGHYIVEYFSPASLERISVGGFDIW